MTTVRVIFGTITEDDVHRAIAQYLDVALPADALFFHPSNGEKRSKAAAGKLKAMGVKPGIPDLWIVWNSRVYCAEVKRPIGGVMSGPQKTIRAVLEANGIPVAVVRSVEGMRDALAMWGIPVRAST